MEVLNERGDPLPELDVPKLLACKSNEKFLEELKKCYNVGKSKEHYLLILTDMVNAISHSNIHSFTRLSIFFDYATKVEDQTTLREYYNNSNNPVINTNLIILACKANCLNILEYLFNGKSNILSNLSVSVGKNVVLPTDVDEFDHNAFYYAIRSGNTDLLDIISSKWPGNYFNDNRKELDEVISAAFDELKLKKIHMLKEMETCVIDKLMNLRFFSDDDKNIKRDIISIRGRVELLLQSIGTLIQEYSNANVVDAKFLFLIKFCVQNIHILKRQLRSTYDRLPWEEIEFCLICFASSHMEKQEMNLFYNVSLNMSKILRYLECFANKLREQKDFTCVNDLPKGKRRKFVYAIIQNNPDFRNLYDDYQQIRDLYSLDKMSDVVKLASLADAECKEGQLVILRALQVVGEHLKDTLETPKLSHETSELFLLSLPKNTRKILIDIRNSMSQVHSNNDLIKPIHVSVFIGVKKETKIVHDVIAHILCNKKLKVIKRLLSKIIDGETHDDFKAISEIFRNTKLSQKIHEDLREMVHDNLEKLVIDLNNNLSDKSNYEKELFSKISELINVEKKLGNLKGSYPLAFATLISLGKSFGLDEFITADIRETKLIAQKSLESVNAHTQSNNLKEIAKLSLKILQCVSSRISEEKLDEFFRITCEMFSIVELETDGIRWIEELKEKSCKERCAFRDNKQGTLGKLENKLSELERVFSSNLAGELMQQVSLYKKNKKLQAVVEILVLDIMSMLDVEGGLKNNGLFLDDATPLLTGKFLRNHLAHDNTVVNLLACDPSAAILCNAKKLISEDVLNSGRKLGKVVMDDSAKLRKKYEQSLCYLIEQETMFTALEEGKIDELKDCIRKGGDLSGTNTNSWTALHFAAKGPSLDTVKFVLGQSIDPLAKDVNGQSPIHIAAIHGRKHIVEFFVREVGVSVDIGDKIGRTPLHVAASNGQKETVEILLKNNANPSVKDSGGFSPVHYSIRNNHVEVAKILLEKETNVDCNEVNGGFTPLHVAAQSGSIQLVTFLLENNANVNAKTDREVMPIHIATANGYFEVVKALILSGAAVNVAVLDGCTPLHQAVETGHAKIVELLLEYGADDTAADKVYHSTPLQQAAAVGNLEIVSALLKHKADASICQIDGLTPLHFAARNGHLEVVVALLEHGVDIRSRDKISASAIHYAAMMGNKEICEILMREGADINETADNLQAPLHAAVLNDHAEVVAFLLSNGANVEGYDFEGNTPLLIASARGNVDVIDLLLKGKALVTATDGNGMTPLHLAAVNGHKDAVSTLIEYNANVNSKANRGLTPLQAAIMEGHKEIVVLLLINNAEVNTKGIFDSTPVNVAIEAGQKEILEILIANGACVNTESVDNLLSAIKQNNTEIVEILLENGAGVNGDDGEPLLIACFKGYRGVVDVLIKYGARIDFKGPDGISLLHVAAKSGRKEIVNKLIELGADINANAKGLTPLSISAKEGFEQIVEILAAKGADVNVVNDEGTPLHIAAVEGHSKIVKVLLDFGVNVNIKDHSNSSALELAIRNNHLKVVKVLMESKMCDLNAKDTDGGTILHVACCGGNMEVVKYLVDEGCDINVKNTSGSKSVHVAALAGHKDIVEFFINQGINTNEVDASNQTLLHYAAKSGRVELVKYLVTQGADVNAKDNHGSTPIEIAVEFHLKNVIEVLLENGAIYNYNTSNKSHKMAGKNDAIIVLKLTNKLFQSVKRNNCTEVRKYIKEGASINAKHPDGGTCLHFAAWKGFDELVSVLLEHKANPNEVNSAGCTPLHYAAKFARLDIVKNLLSYGAVYNALSDNGKTPYDICEDVDIKRLLSIINDAFKKVNKNNAQVINDLNKIKDLGTVKAVMSARNRENRSLVVVAMHCNFSKVEKLKQIFHEDISDGIDSALGLVQHGLHEQGLNVLNEILKIRTQVLGPDNPGTLNVQSSIAKVLYKQGQYQEALNMFEEICRKQKEILGSCNQDTMVTKSDIGLVLHRLGRDEEALKLYIEISQQQTDLLGPNHADTISTQFHMAAVLMALGKFEEALKINKAVFQLWEVTKGPDNMMTIIAKNNMAMALSHLGKYEEALKINQEVLKKKKKCLGINNADTLRTMHNMAGILVSLNKPQEALEGFKEVLELQKKALGENNPETLNTQYSIGNLLYGQGKHISALKTFGECLDKRKAVFGHNHPSVKDILTKIEIIKMRFTFEGCDFSEVLQNLRKEINLAASKGDEKTLQKLLDSGVDVNEKDIDGRSPLHYAVSSGHRNIVNRLIQNGVKVTIATNKGNTALHTAASKGNKGIVEDLLEKVSGDKLNEFVNAKTAANGTTALHVAAKNGCLDIVRSLLKHGAVYNVKDVQCKIPVHLTLNQDVSNLLKLIDDLFRDTKLGKIEVINKLKGVKPDLCLAITNCRDMEGKTLLQVALANKHKSLASKLLELLKK